MTTTTAKPAAFTINPADVKRWGMAAAATDAVADVIRRETPAVNDPMYLAALLLDTEFSRRRAVRTDDAAALAIAAERIPAQYAILNAVASYDRCHTIANAALTAATIWEQHAWDRDEQARRDNAPEVTTPHGWDSTT